MKRLFLAIALFGACKGNGHNAAECRTFADATERSADLANATPQISGTDDQIVAAAQAAATAYTEARKLLDDVVLTDKTLDGYRHALMDNLDRRIAVFEALVKLHDQQNFDAATAREDAADADEEAIDRNVHSYCGMKP